MTMRAQDWRYMGEGGKHAVFGYEPTRIKVEEAECIGYVLRISKQDIACSVLFSQARNTQKDCSQVETVESSLINDDDETTDKDDLFYIRHIVAPSLRPYVEVPRTVRFDWEFLNQLRTKCLAEAGCIPEKRSADWSHETYDTHGDSISQQFQRRPPFVIGVLLPDYRRPLTLSLAPSLSCCRDDVENENESVQVFTCCSIEIKPKAGYLAFSPLVSPNHRVKYSTSRFQLLQKLYAEGKHSRAWMDVAKARAASVSTVKRSHGHTGSTCSSTHSCSDVSDYDPLDLFSGETGRIHKAIESLMACPQNCFKMWMGDGESVSSSSFSQQAQWPKNKTTAINSCDGHNVDKCDTSGGDGHDNTAGLHEAAIFSCASRAFLANVLTTILHEEDLLNKLLKLQRLDILDGDGAILVYKRLLALLGDSGRCEESTCELVERCLDSVSVQSFTTTTSDHFLPHPLLRASPFRLSCCANSRINSFCSEVETVQRVTRQPTPVDDAMVASSVIDEAHRRATQILHSMDKDELQYLLQLWLLSLAMCDVSFFVILRELPQRCTGEVTQEEKLRGNTTNNDTTSIYTCFRVEERQSEGKPGILSFVSQRDNNESSTRRRLAYELKVIDCDQKPAKKLRSRDKKEDLFDFFANENEFNRSQQ